MKIYFGTVIRSAPVHFGGELVCLDWDTKEVVRKVPVFPRNPSLDHDPNPRGNTRGCRGISVSGNQVVAANYHTLDIYDLDLRLQRRISHGTMVGLHEICPTENQCMWVASTAIDAALKLDLKSGQLVKEFWPREMPEFQRSFNLEPLDVDKTADNRASYLGESHVHHPSHLHLNAVCEWQGDVFALFHSFGAICNLSKGSIVVRDPALVKGHNLTFLDDGTAVTNDTFRHSVRLYDIHTGNLLRIINTGDFRWVRSLQYRAAISNLGKRVLLALGLTKSAIPRPLFLRGLAVCGDSLFAGLSPASILRINLRTGVLVDAYRFSRDVNECIHGLAVSP